MERVYVCNKHRVNSWLNFFSKINGGLKGFNSLSTRDIFTLDVKKTSEVETSSNFFEKTHSHGEEDKTGEKGAKRKREARD